MEPIEQGSTHPQDPETGTTAQPDGFRPEFWRDVAEVKRGAVESINRPQVRQLANAVALLCTLVEDLAQRVEALESPKPCEGCGEGAPIDDLVAALVAAIEAGQMPELVAAVLAKHPEKDPGFLRRTLEAVGLKVGG